MGDSLHVERDCSTIGCTKLRMKRADRREIKFAIKAQRFSHGSPKRTGTVQVT